MGLCRHRRRYQRDFDCGSMRCCGAPRRRKLPVLAVGIGLYLPPTVGVTLGLGAVLGWLIDRGLRGRADEERPSGAVC
jgi:uncharacterized oligopeptide transporter (OPT) family protein